MLRLIANKCTDVLVNHGTIQREKKAVYIYGFELFWSTTFCIVSILTLGTVCGYPELAVGFLLYFIPIRVPAGGYHAKSYGQCFLLTNFIAIACVIVSKALWLVLDNEMVIWLMLAGSWGYIWKYAPIISKKYPLEPERIAKNRRYAHMVLVVEMAVLMLVRICFYSCVFFTAAVTSCAVAVMMWLAEAEGKKQNIL